MLSDSFRVIEEDDIVYRVECKMVRKGAVQVDIGANPSTGEGEAGEEAEPEAQVDDGSYEVIDVVDCCRLEPTNYDKKGYITHIKEYMKAVKERLKDRNPDRVPIFEKAAATYVKKIVENFSKFDFYVGENMDPEAMTVLYETCEDGKTFMIYWKDGLRAEKY